MFSDSDLFIKYIKDTANSTDDDFITSRYVGFIAVSAVTIYEINVKQLLKEFANKTHPMLGNFASIAFDKLNARNCRDDIEKYLKHFGEEYSNRFKIMIDDKEDELVKVGSVKGSYASLLTWRHQFVHDGTLPNQATFNESLKAYELGKEVIVVLQQTLQPREEEA